LPNNRTQNQSETLFNSISSKTKTTNIQQRSNLDAKHDIQKIKALLNFGLETNLTKNNRYFFVKLQTQQEMKHWNRK
jgi:hypothetical protein